jgi:hypothetical protein
VDALLRAEASGVVLDAGLSRDLLEPLHLELERQRQELPVIAVESPCPRSTEGREPDLCSADRDESRAALDGARATIRRADALGARLVVLRLGEVRPVARDWIYARDRFLRGALDAQLAQRLVDARDQTADRALDGARRALELLARDAESAGVTLALRNSRRYVDLPSPREMDLLMADLRGAPVAPLLDVAAAHLPDLMGFAPLSLTLATFGQAPLIYLGDACGPVGPLPPGRGVLDLAGIARQLPLDAQLAFSPWAGLTLEETLAALPAIARLVARES